NKNHFDAWPSWKPDGSEIAFCRNDGQEMAIWTVSLQNGNKDNVSNPKPGLQFDRIPCYSPDGLQIAFSRLDYTRKIILPDKSEVANVNNDIYITDSDGQGTPEPIINNDQSGHNDFYAKWG